MAAGESVGAEEEKEAGKVVGLNHQGQLRLHQALGLHPFSDEEQ